MSDLRIKLDDLLNNPAPRVPITLCLDTSGSMAGEKLNELNRGIAKFYESVRMDCTASSSAEAAIVTFNSQANLIQDFKTIGSCHRTPQIPSASGCTVLGSGVNLALDTLERQKQCLKMVGVDYYQPWLVLMTDGQPCGESSVVTDQAANRCWELERSGKLVVYPIAIGNDADMRALQKFTTGTPLRLRGLCFQEFFQWLSASVIRVSVSRPGEDVPRDWEGMNKWRQI